MLYSTSAEGLVLQPAQRFSYIVCLKSWRKEEKVNVILEGINLRSFVQSIPVLNYTDCSIREYQFILKKTLAHV